jgi:hypothetical protein
MLQRLIDLMTGPRIPHVPTPRLETATDGSGGEFTQVVISDKPDEKLFAYVAAALQDALKGQWSQQLTGLDQAYWDLEADDGKIVLHLEHYVGISVHPAELSQATDANKALVLKVFEVISRLSSNVTPGR